ncbi:MAG: hypothetical protein R3D33_08360 [Hyphomicrobiaceae bacterium]
MMRRGLLCVALIAGLAGTAHAIDMPKSTEECYSLVDKLAEAAENKNPGDEAVVKIGELMTAMNESCEAGNLDEAARTGEELAKVIDLLP